MNDFLPPRYPSSSGRPLRLWKRGSVNHPLSTLRALCCPILLAREPLFVRVSRSKADTSLRVIPVATERREMFTRSSCRATACMAARRYAPFAARTNSSIPIPPRTSNRLTGRSSCRSESSIRLSVFVGFKLQTTRCRVTELGSLNAAERFAPRPNRRTTPNLRAVAFFQCWL